MRIVGYAYEAAVHCPLCAAARFGVHELDRPETVDNEGNPIGVCFSTDETDYPMSCDDCFTDIESVVINSGE